MSPDALCSVDEVFPGYRSYCECHASPGEATPAFISCTCLPAASLGETPHPSDRAFNANSTSAGLFFALNRFIFLQRRVAVVFCCFLIANDSVKANNDNGVGPPDFGNRQKIAG